jgi:hypothetical protein
MARDNTGKASSSDCLTGISDLQGEAWAVWNASYHSEARDAYRAVGRALYRQDVHNRISSLFARLDEQNHQLDALEKKQAA